MVNPVQVAVSGEDGHQLRVVGAALRTAAVAPQQGGGDQGPVDAVPTLDDVALDRHRGAGGHQDAVGVVGASPNGISGRHVVRAVTLGAQDVVS